MTEELMCVAHLTALNAKIKKQSSFVKSTADKTAELWIRFATVFLNRFLRFGPQSGPPVEMTLRLEIAAVASLLRNDNRIFHFGFVICDLRGILHCVQNDKHI